MLRLINSMKIKINKSKLINFGLLFLVLSIVFSSIPVDRLNALNLKEETTNPVTNAKSYMYYQAMRVCILNTNLSLSNNTIDGSFGKMSESDANSGKWFKNTTNPKIGYFANSYGLSTDNDQVGCAGDDAGWILDAVKIWGYNNPIEALCQFGMVRANGQDCYKGSGSLMLENPKNIALGMLRYEDFDKNIRTNVYGGSGPELTKAGEYEMYHSVFFTGCLGDKNKAEDSSAPDDDFTYNISVYNPSTKSVESKKYYGTKKHSEEISYSEEINTVTGTLNKTNPVKSTCENLAKKLNAESAGAYAEFDKANPGEIEKAKEESTGGESEDGETSCAIAGIGWILCPIVNFIAGIADQAFDFLSNHFLYINPKMLDTSSTTYSAWSVMRNLANVAFVIVFLIIIFSQISSFGITNYGIKKMLPRLIIAAILVNLSFYICQIVVDLSNILGYSMNNILTNIGNSAAGEDLNTAKASMSWWSVESGGFGGLMGKILATGGALAFLYLAVSLPVLIAAVFALTAILFILIARQAIVVILIAVAPLAFVAFLLPNTEKMFDKWRKTFTSMLILFPVISVVFGASSLAAKILSATFHGGSAGDTNGFIGQLIAAGAMVLPLFLVPGIIKKSIDGFGNLSAKMSGIGDSLGKKAGSSYENSSFGKYQKTKKDVSDALTRSGNYTGYNPLRKSRSRLNSKLNSSQALNKLTRGYGNTQTAYGIELAEAQWEKDVKAAQVQLSQLNLGQDQLRELANGGDAYERDSTGGLVMKNGKPVKIMSSASNKALQAASIQNVVANNDIDGINELWDKSMSWNNDKDIKSKYTLADSLMKSSNRPAWYGAGAIATMRNNTDHKNHKSLVEKAINDQVYSPEKIASADKDELKILANSVKDAEMGGYKNISRDKHQVLVNNAYYATTDSILKSKIGKNKNNIESIMKNEKVT